MLETTEQRQAAEIEELKARLAESEDTLRAIRAGEVDALVVDTAAGTQVYTLEGADQVFRVIIQEMSEGAVITTPAGVITYANCQFAELLKTPVEKLTGSSLYLYVPPENENILRRLISQPGRQEIPLMAAGGNRVSVFAASNRLEFDSTSVACLVFTDLTLQKRTEQLLAGGQLIQAIMTYAPQATIVCGSDGVILYASRVADDLCGCLAAGRRFDEAFGFLKYKDRQVTFTDIVSGAIPPYTELSCGGPLSKPGIFLLLHGHLTAEDKLRGSVITLVDITERGKLDRAKDEFISLVSHELRTPLTVILGSLKTAIAPGITPEDMRALIDNAIEGGASMEAIINNLLELSRAQASRLKLESRMLDMGKALKDVVDKVNLHYPGFRYKTAVPHDLPRVTADPLRIERILYNLIENAVKYSPAGSEVTVGIKYEPKGLVISVTDRGPGIPKEKQIELFEPFKRLAKEQDAAKGLGLGLVVCKRLVEAHGGEIWIESDAGKGCTFAFSLPVNPG